MLRIPVVLHLETSHLICIVNLMTYKKNFVTFFDASQNGSKKVYSANIYLFKVSNEKTRRRCAICSKLTLRESVALA